MITRLPPEEFPPVPLPTRKTPPDRDLAKKIIFIYGEPKIGKSTWASHWPGALFLETDPGGLKELHVAKIVCNDWATLQGVLKTLKTTTHKVKTIVVDTADMAYKYCQRHIRQRYNIEYEGDLGYGKGWDLVSSAWRNWIIDLASLGCGVICTSHSREKNIGEGDNGYAVQVPTLDDRAAQILIGLSDIVMFAHVQRLPAANGGAPELVRVCHTKPSKLWLAGDRTGRLPRRIPLDYEAFIAAYNSTAPASDSDSTADENQQKEKGNDEQ